MTGISNHAEEIEKHTKKLTELETNLFIEEKEFDSIRDGLKGISPNFFELFFNE